MSVQILQNLNGSFNYSRETLSIRTVILINFTENIIIKTAVRENHGITVSALDLQAKGRGYELHLGRDNFQTSSYSTCPRWRILKVDRGVLGDRQRHQVCMGIHKSKVVQNACTEHIRRCLHVP